MVPCRLNFPLCTLFFNGGTSFWEGINLIFSNGVLRDSFLIRSSVTTIVFFLQVPPCKALQKSADDDDDDDDDDERGTEAVLQPGRTHHRHSRARIG